MNRAGRRILPVSTLAIALLALAGCEAPDNARPDASDNSPVSEPIPLQSAPPVQVSDLPPEISSPITAPSNAPLPPEGDTLTSGQVLDRLRARLSTPTCIVGPNNTRWRHKYAGYPQHFAEEVQDTLPMMLVVLDQLEQNKLPGEFALIPIVESWYHPEVHSFGGAAGMWQLLSETSRNNGATVVGGFDGRLSALDSTQAAMNYLGKLHAMFNDWRLAAMAYNSGEYRLMRTMSPEELAERSAGGVHYRRPEGLSMTTYEYVSKMRALTCLLAQPERQGIPIDPTIPVTHWVPYTVPPDIDSLDELASRLNTDPEALKAFNRGFHNGRIVADAPRTILVPAGTRSRWSTAGEPAPPPSMTTQAPSTVVPAAATGMTASDPPGIAPTVIAPHAIPTTPQASPPTSPGVAKTLPAGPAPVTVAASMPAHVDSPHPVPPATMPPSLPVVSTSHGATGAKPAVQTTGSVGTFVPPAAFARASGPDAAVSPPAPGSQIKPPTLPASAPHAVPPGMPQTQPTGAATAPVVSQPSRNVEPAASSSTVPVATSAAAQPHPDASRPEAVPSQAVPVGPSTNTTTTAPPPAKPAEQASLAASPPARPMSVTPASTLPVGPAAQASPVAAAPVMHSANTATVSVAPVAVTPTAPMAIVAKTPVPASSTKETATDPASSPLPAVKSSPAAAAPTPTVVTASQAAPPPSPEPAATTVSNATRGDTRPVAPPVPAPIPAATVPANLPTAALPAAVDNITPAQAFSPAVGLGTSIPHAVPQTTAAPVSVVAPQQSPSITPLAPRTHKVVFGDSLESIAQRYSLKVDDLRTWNHLDPNAHLFVDQILKLEP